MTDKSFSAAVWAEYLSKCANNADKKHSKDQEAVQSFVEKTIAKLGYPNKDEVHDVVKNFKDFDLTPIADRIPTMVSGYMHDEKRAFDLPSVDPSTAKATIGVRAVDEKVNEGIIQFGENKGKPYKSVTAAHEEIYVRNNTKIFKK